MRATTAGFGEPGNAAALIAASELMPSDEGLTLLRSGVQQAPDDVRLLNALAVLYGREQMFTEALQLLGTATHISPDEPVSWLNMGVCCRPAEIKTGLKPRTVRHCCFSPISAELRNT